VILSEKNNLEEILDSFYLFSALCCYLNFFEASPLSHLKKKNRKDFRFYFLLFFKRELHLKKLDGKVFINKGILPFGYLVLLLFLNTLLSTYIIPLGTRNKLLFLICFYVNSICFNFYC